VVQAAAADDGDPAARMLSPQSPPRLNFIGTALPAFAPVTQGAGATGLKNPVTIPEVRAVDVVHCWRAVT
jgi:hypothetical protein